MKAIKEVKRFFWLSVAFLCIMSTTILFMPLAVNSMNRNYVIAVGASFWSSAVIGYVLLIVANIARRRYIIVVSDKNISMDCHAGAITFFANKLAIVFDITMMFSFVLFILLFFTKLSDSYFVYIILFFLILSINLHCLFNGRIYKSTKIRGSRRETSYE